MSQYIVLLSTAAYSLSEQQPPGIRYAITKCNQPDTGLELLNNYSPIPLFLEHAIYSRNRTDYLLQTLQIKFRKQHTGSFWYALTDEQIEFIKSISDANLSSMVGLIHRSERKPELTGDEVAQLLAESLKKAEEMLA